MKYIKILGLLGVAAAAMMAFASSASATTVTGPTFDTLGNHTSQSQVETPTIHAVNHGGHVRLHNSIANIECQSTVTGDVTTHGSGITAAGHIDELLFFNCTNDWVVHVTNPGELIVHYTSGSDGTLTSTGATVVATRFGISCGYRTENTHIGTVTGEKGPNGEATLDIGAVIPRHSGSFLCGGSSAQWTGSYTTTHTLKVDP